MSHVTRRAAKTRAALRRSQRLNVRLAEAIIERGGEVSEETAENKVPETTAGGSVIIPTSNAASPAEVNYRGYPEIIADLKNELSALRADLAAARQENERLTDHMQRLEYGFETLGGYDLVTDLVEDVLNDWKGGR